MCAIYISFCSLFLHATTPSIKLSNFFPIFFFSSALFLLPFFFLCKAPHCRPDNVAHFTPFKYVYTWLGVRMHLVFFFYVLFFFPKFNLQVFS